LTAPTARSTLSRVAAEQGDEASRELLALHAVYDGAYYGAQKEDDLDHDRSMQLILDVVSATSIVR
jgi:hypothetical protein